MVPGIDIVGSSSSLLAPRGGSGGSGGGSSGGGGGGANSANTVDLRDTDSPERSVSHRSFGGTDGMRDLRAPLMWDA